MIRNLIFIYSYLANRYYLAMLILRKTSFIFHLNLFDKILIKISFSLLRTLNYYSYLVFQNDNSTKNNVRLHFQCDKTIYSCHLMSDHKLSIQIIIKQIIVDV